MSNMMLTHKTNLLLRLEIVLLNLTDYIGRGGKGDWDLYHTSFMFSGKTLLNAIKFRKSLLFSRSTLLWSEDLHRVARLSVCPSVCLFLIRFLLAAKSRVTSFWVSDSLDTNLILDN